MRSRAIGFLIRSAQVCYWIRIPCFWFDYFARFNLTFFFLGKSCWRFRRSSSTRHCLYSRIAFTRLSQGKSTSAFTDFLYLSFERDDGCGEFRIVVKRLRLKVRFRFSLFAVIGLFRPDLVVSCLMSFSFSLYVSSNLLYIYSSAILIGDED